MENTQPATKTNPLSKYFRQPAIHMKLPSNGQYWPEGSLNLPVTGEIPVYPMTARDEITLRTPDALMNGSSIAEIVQSCCPSIVDAWKMPSIDIDAVLIGIRIASYKNDMDVDSLCPHCNAENNNTVDLQQVLSNITTPDYSQKIEVGELKIKICPQQFFNINKKNVITFEENRIMNSLNDESLDLEVKANQINRSMGVLVDIGLDIVTSSTEYIELDDGARVTKPEHIREFYENTDGKITKLVQERLAELNREGAIKAPRIACTSCAKEFQLPLEFDYSNFFGIGS